MTPDPLDLALAAFARIAHLAEAAENAPLYAPEGVRPGPVPIRPKGEQYRPGRQQMTEVRAIAQQAQRFLKQAQALKPPPAA